MRKVFVFALLIVVFLACTAEQCTKDDDEYVLAVYKSMVTAAITYDVTMRSVADLHAHQGLVDEGFKTQVILYGMEFWKSYHSLQRVLEMYVQGDADKASVEKAKAEFDNAFTYFSTYAKGAK